MFSPYQIEKPEETQTKHTQIHFIFTLSTGSILFCAFSNSIHIYRIGLDFCRYFLSMLEHEMI